MTSKGTFDGRHKSGGPVFEAEEKVIIIRGPLFPNYWTGIVTVLSMFDELGFIDLHTEMKLKIVNIVIVVYLSLVDIFHSLLNLVLEVHFYSHIWSFC